MHKLFLFFIIIAEIFFPLVSSAACSLEETNASSFLSGCSSGTIGIDPALVQWEAGTRERVWLVATGAISLWALLAVGAIVWAGIQYTKSFGDDEKLKKAKSTGIYAVIGLVLMMLSFSLVDVFINFLFRITESA